MTTKLPSYIDPESDLSFWDYIDSDSGWNGQKSHRSDCSRLKGDWERCTCGCISDWAQDRADACMALNSNGERCRNHAPRNSPFCVKYHQKRSIDALASTIPSMLAMHQQPENELGEFFAALAKACGLTNRQMVAAARWLSRSVAQEIDDRLEAVALVEDVRLADAVTTARAEEKTALYRHFDADGVLLYVGISNDPAIRFKTHASQSAWMQFALTHTGEWFSSREEALAAEAVAIREELPVFNKAGASPDRNERAKEYLLAHEAWEFLIAAI